MDRLSDSSGSLHSFHKSQDFINSLTNEELQQLIEETVQANNVLEAETSMFEKYLTRVEAREHKFDSSPAPYPTKDALVRRRSKSISTSSDRAQKLTTEQKCEIAQKEIEELRGNILALDEESEKVLDNYMAQMEEADISLSEVKKDIYEFERDILKGAVNQRSKKIIAEKCQKYFDDKAKVKDSLIEKLRLKNSTLKVQMKKLNLQLKQKEEMGEVLNEVDFNQLKIENQQYLEKIDERNQDLLRLKLMTGNTLQVLNSYKQRLQTLIKEAARLRSDMTLREDLQGKIEAETRMVEAERAQAELINKRLHRNLTDFQIPDVMEYVLGKAEIYSMQKKIKNWERKVDMAELALKTHRRAWHVMKMQAEQKAQWKEMIDV